MNPKNFFYLNALVVLAVIVFLVRRPAGTRLRWRGGPKPKAPLANPGYRPVTESSGHDRDEKSLNVFFNFNGHLWDAYEVLGLPAGSTWAAVLEAHKRAINNIGPDSSREFIDMAVEAIRKHQK